MSRIFSAAFSEVASGTAIKDLIEVFAGTNNSLRVLELELSSPSVAEEKFLLELYRISASGSGGSAATERPHDDNSTADAAVEFNNGTQATKNGAVLKAWEWSNIIPFLYQPWDDMRIVVPGGTGLVLELARAPTTGVNLTGSITWEEF